MKSLFKKTVTMSLMFVFVFLLTQCKKEIEHTLIVGSPQLDGCFMLEFGTNKYDARVVNLIHGYELYAITEFGEIILNETVVDEVITSVATNGDKTYTFAIHQDLKWSDDQPVTAKDFVFSILMRASKEWDDARVKSSIGENFVGYEEYRVNNKSADVRFQGVQLQNDHAFSLTIKNGESQGFYETKDLIIHPLPMHVLAPEGTVIDSNSNGAKVDLNGFDLVKDITGIGGYGYIPTVTSGPYRFVSFIDNEVILIRNDHFKGNVYGDTPSIKNIRIKRVNQTLDVDLVISGEIDLVDGVIEGSKIQVAEASDTTSSSYYSRNGYGLIAMEAHFGPTMDYRVRQAIAYITNRDHLIDVILGGYGSKVYSEYGTSQWMYIQSEAWIEENINTYDFSIEHANNILNETEWIYEDDLVTLFNSDKALITDEYYRYNEDGKVLNIEHVSTPSGTFYEDIAKYAENMPKIGILYNKTEKEFQTILDHFYYGYQLNTEDKQYHLFNVATNFDVDYDPYMRWHSDTLNTYMNPCQLEDSQTNPAAPLNEANGTKTIDELTIAMRNVEPGDTETYLQLWRQYQLRWNSLIPNIPLYSNQYYSIYNSSLKGVQVTPFWDWTLLINNIYFE